MMLRMVVEDRTDIAGSVIQRDPKDLRYIVLHHTMTGSDAKPENVVYIDRATGRRYPAPYHYLIYTSGRIVKTRPILSVGTCVAKMNTKCVCVAGVGDWERGDPTTPVFLDAVAWLVSEILKQYPSLEVIPHRKLVPTSCPGKHFPLEVILARIAKAGSV
jgi:hypothetical protein